MATYRFDIHFILSSVAEADSFLDDPRIQLQTVRNDLESIIEDFNHKNPNRYVLSAPSDFITNSGDDQKTIAPCDSHEPGHETHPRNGELFRSQPVEIVKVAWELGTHRLSMVGGQEQTFFHHRPNLIAAAMESSEDNEALLAQRKNVPGEALLRVRLSAKRFKIFSMSTQPLSPCSFSGE